MREIAKLNVNKGKVNSTKTLKQRESERERTVKNCKKN